MNSNHNHAGRGFNGPRTNFRPDTGCIAPGCAGNLVLDAPIPLCEKCLRLAFAHVVLTNDLEVAPTGSSRRGPTRAGWVYFAMIGNLLKIGFTTRPEQRMAAISATELLHLEPGTLQDERRFHAKFAHLRAYGEIFRAEPELLSCIQELKAQAAA